MYPEKQRFAEQLGQAEAKVRLVCEYLDIAGNRPANPDAAVLVLGEAADSLTELLEAARREATREPNPNRAIAFSTTGVAHA